MISRYTLLGQRASIPQPFFNLCSRRHVFTTSRLLLDSKHVEKVFGEKSWKTFTKKVPNWEKDLKDMSKDTLNTILVACGIVPLKTPGMATALVEHFNPTDTAATFVDEVSNFAKAKTSHQKATHAAAAKKALRELASEFSDRDDEYCHPRRMKNTWQRNGWKREVLRGRSELTGLDSAQSTSRQPAIMGFHNATGMGKTHSLLEALRCCWRFLRHAGHRRHRIGHGPPG